jgi:UV DNA damage endonuclease
MFDQMGLDQTHYYPVNIHGGAKNKYENVIANIKNLPDFVKNRLTLENDEFSYSVKELYKISCETKIPIVFDSHHHSFLTDDLSGEEAMELAISTWNGIKPITHLSNTEPELLNSKSKKDLRKHSFDIYSIPDYQLKANNSNIIDIDLEFKGKNLVFEKATKTLGLKL